MTDHPRLCGEKIIKDSHCAIPAGSPPPMRGKDDMIEIDEAYSRITPAYAGKRTITEINHILTRDHPRLCGEKDLH